MGDGGSHSQMFARSTHVMLPAPRPKKKNFRPPAAASQGSCLQRNMLRVLSFRLFLLLSDRAILCTEIKRACAPAVCRHACSGDVRKVFYILVVGLASLSLGSPTHDREDSVFAHPAAESFFFLGPGWAERLSSLSHSAGVNSKSWGKWPE